MKFILGLGLAAALLAGCGGGDDPPAPAEGEQPQDALERQIGFLSDGQSGRAYAELHPLQQAFITEAHYARCVDERGAVEASVVKVKEIYDEEADIPGTDQVQASKAITAELKITMGTESIQTTDTFHEFLVDGAWKFAVSDADTYKAGNCP